MMIFVTVGLHNQGFDRLIRKMDEISGKKEHKIVMQIGSTQYRPVNSEFFLYASYDEILHYFSEADLIISHAGVGTILDALSLNKPLILAPRLKKYNEAYDDHQIEICSALNKKYGIDVVLNVDDIYETINNVTVKGKVVRDESLVNYLSAYLQKM